MYNEIETASPHTHTWTAHRRFFLYLCFSTVMCVLLEWFRWKCRRSDMWVWERGARLAVDLTTYICLYMSYVYEKHFSIFYSLRNKFSVRRKGNDTKNWEEGEEKSQRKSSVTSKCVMLSICDETWSTPQKMNCTTHSAQKPVWWIIIEWRKNWNSTQLQIYIHKILTLPDEHLQEKN